MAKRKDFSGCINFPACKAQIIYEIIETLPAKTTRDEIIKLLKGGVSYGEKKSSENESESE